jgi:hypothetical protein
MTRNTVQFKYGYSNSKPNSCRTMDGAASWKAEFERSDL